MTYEEEMRMREMAEAQREADVESEMVKAQYIESFTPQELLYSKQVQGLVDAAEKAHLNSCLDENWQAEDWRGELLQALEKFRGLE